jgi:hypothetical protein
MTTAGENKEETEKHQKAPSNFNDFLINFTNAGFLLVIIAICFASCNDCSSCRKNVLEFKHSLMQQEQR